MVLCQEFRRSGERDGTLKSNPRHAMASYSRYSCAASQALRHYVPRWVVWDWWEVYVRWDENRSDW